MNTFVKQYIPAIDWLGNYKRGDLSGDLTAGIITAILLVPQAMAYSILAGLPPEVGLYASILPPILYAFFGSSRALAVGPVAVASLMVASALSQNATVGTGEYYAAALILAFLIGGFLFLMGVARLGFMANFLSHPVMSGFTSAAAIVIAFSQLKHLLGLQLPRGLRIDEIFVFVLNHLTDINIAALIIGTISIVMLILIRRYLGEILNRFHMLKSLAQGLSKAGPLLLVVAMTTITAIMSLNTSAGLTVIGSIPAGLPSLTLPHFDLTIWGDLAPSAALIALVSFVESIAIARVLGSKRRQKIDVDQELIGLGMANMGAAFTGGSPVCGGFGRSVVNFSAGANSQLAAIVTAILIGLSVMFFTPLFYFLPQAVLAAIIVVAVLGLVDFGVFVTSWKYNKGDAISLLATFVVVMAEGIEAGIVSGVIISIALHLWRNSRPHIAIVGRVGDTEHFRNMERHQVKTCAEVLAIRVDESLFFANAQYLETYILKAVAEKQTVKNVILICSAINTIDTSALESLENLARDLTNGGVVLNLAEVKGPVMDRLSRTSLFNHLGKIYLSTHEAFTDLECA
jgi:SulP family sulfate permease